ncbi:MAG: hypothetical protein II726_02250 [Elusimicrobiaceae bacterium]|nr:hypothetical protein [Elusimicrobiaceae bacterium]
MRDIIYFIVLILIAAGIAYGFDALFSAVLPKSAAGFFIDPFSIGIRPIGIHLNACGIIGLVISFGVIKFILKK